MYRVNAAQQIQPNAIHPPSLSCPAVLGRNMSIVNHPFGVTTHSVLTPSGFLTIVPCFHFISAVKHLFIYFFFYNFFDVLISKKAPSDGRAQYVCADL